MNNTFVVVGGGLAAAHAVAELREAGHDGRIVVVGAEPHLPYERPPVSKSYLTGDSDRAAATVHDEQWYADHAVELRLGVRAELIDRIGHRLQTDQGMLHYEKLLLATGARPRRLPMADESGAHVAYLRSFEDADRIREALAGGARVAVVGGGWIGLEVASAARHAGCEVTVVERAEWPLLPVLGAEVAELLADAHRDRGVRLRLAASIESIDEAGLLLGDGERVAADLVVVGIGAQPNDELAIGAGLETDDGILVDEHLVTADPDVFAAGDVARAHHPLLGHSLRVEHWDTAIAQGRAAARSMLGEDVSYDRMPYFFSDQHDFGLEYVGHPGPQGYDAVEVEHADADQPAFTAWWLRDGRTVAGMHVNRWDEIERIRERVGGVFAH